MRPLFIKNLTEPGHYSEAWPMGRFRLAYAGCGLPEVSKVHNEGHNSRCGPIVATAWP